MATEVPRIPIDLSLLEALRLFRAGGAGRSIFGRSGAGVWFPPRTRPFVRVREGEPELSYAPDYAPDPSPEELVERLGPGAASLFGSAIETKAEW